METISLKALAIKVIEGNRKGNQRETGRLLDGNRTNTWAPPPCGYLIIYSPILNDSLLLTDTEERAEALRAQGIVEPIYTVEEVRLIKGLSPESLKAHHMIKKTFPGAVIKKGQV